MTQRNLIELLEASSPSPRGAVFWREIANNAIRKFAVDTRVLRGSKTVTTIADTKEYNLDADIVEVLKVFTSTGSLVEHADHYSLALKPNGEKGWWVKHDQLILGYATEGALAANPADEVYTLHCVLLPTALTEDNLDSELPIPAQFHEGIEARLMERNAIGDPSTLQYLRGIYKEHMREAIRWGHKQKDGGAFNVLLHDTTLQ